MVLRPSNSARSLVRAKPVRIHVRCFSTKFDIYGNSPIPANKQRFVPSTGTYPKGFRVGSINAGMKPASKSQPDLILVASETPSCGAAVFTKNGFPAASVTVRRYHAKNEGIWTQRRYCQFGVRQHLHRQGWARRCGCYEYGGRQVCVG